MATISRAALRPTANPGWPRLARALRKAASAAGRLFMPPICLHCEGARWGGTPLCLTCLRRLERLGPGGCGRCGAPGCREDHAYWPHAFESARFLFRVTPELTAVVHSFKYRHMRRNAAFLCAWLRYRPDLLDYMRGFDALVPVPLHPARMRERGYNQAHAIATALGKAAGVPVRTDLLHRRRPTGTQTRLGREERLKNLGGAFACPDPDGVEGRRLLLIDDVHTTGATVSSCAGALVKAGCAGVGALALGLVASEAAGDDFVKEMEAVASYLV